ncbi:DDE_Tnp_IS1595 domain-containing protein [Trichonephila clavipes]|nr:DDE_Tnp_IS1595 domain-containing protein [Trichonephila clavipes]
MLGGPNVIVEIDESMFGKRKYYRGKGGNGTWVLGGIERSSNKCFFHMVQHRSKDILHQSIKSNIKEGSTIISDCWKAYDCLEDEGFLHLSVNHSMYFKDPETGAHTNSIEGSCSAIKKSLHGTRRCKDQFDSYLAEYMWRNIKRPSNLNDLFTAFLEAVKEIYPPLEELA